MPRDQVDRISPERAKHLERNRIAANKCRLKKKREHQAIQNSLHNETARHDSLMAELNTLREEIWTLKNTVFAHASCNDDHINRQLASMSENLVGASPDQLQIPSPTLSSPSWSDKSAMGNSRKGSNADSEASENQLFTDPALYDATFDGMGEFSFDRLINMENV